MKNYYEILEVDKEASLEIIDKAYKVLAKKYHPDMNPDDKKVWAEEQFKKINEAYEVLSDPIRRDTYNQELNASTIDYSKKYEELCKQQEILKQELQALRNQNRSAQNVYQNTSVNYAPPQQASTQSNTQTTFHRRNTEPDINQIRREEFNRAYRNILSQLGYTVREKKSLKDLLALLFTILLLIALFFILWHIPFTKSLMLSFYENNEILKAIVSIFKQ